MVQTIGEGNSSVLNFNGDLVNVTITNGVVQFSFVDLNNVTTAATAINAAAKSSSGFLIRP